MDPIIRIENLHHIYQGEGNRSVHALRGINLAIRQGEYLVILGHNGSGKSTLAKHLNALLLPTGDGGDEAKDNDGGNVWVKQWNTRDYAHLLDIRSTVGMVFQTPDNQIVATIVEEDIAFGPENLGVERDEMVRRIDWALDQVDLQPLRHRAPHLLSGGQKQRVCIAGVLAMQPEVLVLDEATAMLDPLGRQEVLDVAHRLNQEEGVTVVAITHFMAEAIQADRVIVMDEGEIALEGTPRELFRQVDELRALHLDVPPIAELALALHQQDSSFPTELLAIDELVDALAARLNTDQSAVPEVMSQEVAPQGKYPGNETPTNETPTNETPPIIHIEHLAHDYMRSTPLEVRALHDVNIDIHRGEIVGIIGHTGSGKSTAVQYFNGLIRPHAGKVTIFEQDLNTPQTDLRTIRQRVGLVFQFPEAQLFERYVGDDVAYGPRNQDLSREDVRARVRKAMESVGLGFEEFKDRMTFSLSGGQMRRVALAGVLALEPEVLVLDEPTAGLDPQGRRQLLDHILALHAAGITLVLISHNMEELAEVCDRLYVISDGRTVMAGTPATIFARGSELRELGLDTPAVTRVVERLMEQGLLAPQESVYTVEQAAMLLGKLLVKS